MDRLEIEGNKKRFTDDVAFKENLRKSAFADKISLLKDDIEFRKLMDMDREQFVRATANMDINTAAQVVRDDIYAANQRAKFEAGSSILSGGLQSIDQYREYDKTTPSKPEKN
jgi:hypothetical protein